MPDKLLESSSSSSPGILQMQHINREKRKTVNVTWLCCAIALVCIVLVGFAFLLRNFFGRWPGINNNSFLGGSKSSFADDNLPIYPFMGNGHSYDTAIPGSNDGGGSVQRGGEGVGGSSRGSPVVDEKEIYSRPSTIADRNREMLFSENDQVKLDFVRRAQWGAHAAKRKFYFKSFVLEKVIVLETATENCYNEDQCSQLVRSLQKLDMNTNSLDDIRYNFLIGGDGSVFEGRGFSGIGEHTPNFDNNSIGIAVIGKFDEVPPTEAQVISLRKLLQFGIAWENLKSNYELFGYDQLVPDDVADQQKQQPQGPAVSGSSTERSTGMGKKNSNRGGNPGIKLFSIIRKWPHWTENNFYKTFKSS